MAGATANAERLRYRISIIEHAASLAAYQMRRELVWRPDPRRRASGERRRVAFLSPFPRSQHGTVSRFDGWLPRLATAGWEAEILTACSSEDFEHFDRGDSAADLRFFRTCLRNQWANLRKARDADVVVLHRGLLPFSPWQRPSFEQELVKANPHLVYDFFDAIWLGRQDAAALPLSPAGRWLHPANKIERVVQLARVVTVSNDRLAEWARAHHSDVRVIPMLIDVDSYEPRLHERHAPVVLGWVGNRHQLPRLLSLAEPLRRLAAQRDILLRVASAESFDIPGVPLELRTHPWSPERDRDDFAGLDIGLLPLEENSFDRGKSPFKLLQYAAAGVPMVASPVATGLESLNPGESFLPAGSDEEWLEALLRLADDPELRQRMAAAAREAIRRNYSFHAYARTFTEALDAAARGPAESTNFRAGRS